jgi:hypothetical protein
MTTNNIQYLHSRLAKLMYLGKSVMYQLNLQRSEERVKFGETKVKRKKERIHLDIKFCQGSNRRVTKEEQFSQRADEMTEED